MKATEYLKVALQELKSGTPEERRRLKELFRYLKRVSTAAEAIDSGNEETCKWVSDMMSPTLPECGLKTVEGFPPVSIEPVERAATDAGDEVLADPSDADLVVVAAKKFVDDSGVDKFETLDISRQIKVLSSRYPGIFSGSLNVSRALGQMADKRAPLIEVVGVGGNGDKVKRKVYRLTSYGANVASDLEKLLFFREAS